ncbi:MAG: hypothetical protein AAFY21_12400, partial [Cyanobacteria bacterium J06641_2]
MVGGKKFNIGIPPSIFNSNLCSTACNLISLSKGNLAATLDEIISKGVAEVFVCSWESIEHRMYLYWKLRNAGIILHILPIELQAVEQRLELKMLGGKKFNIGIPPSI